MRLQKSVGLLLCAVVGLLIFLTQTAHAQRSGWRPDSVEHHIKRYQQSYPTSLLFLHFDKTVYTNNDNVWFTAYLLKGGQLKLHNLLSVCLVNDLDRTIAVQEKFVMNNGLAFGNMMLHDSIAPGNYTFIAYTNRMVNNQPEALFKQRVTVKSTSQANVRVSMALEDTASSGADKPHRLALTLNGDDYLPVANAPIKYQVFGTDTTTVSGIAKTNKAGEHIISTAGGKTMVRAQIKYKNVSKYVFFALPQKLVPPVIKFYPEGGTLCNGLLSRVGWEATQPDGAPVRLKGVLYSNDQVIDTLQTDSYGMGSFLLLPQAGKTYKFKVLGLAAWAKQVYTLPASITTGLVANIGQAVANDTLALTVSSTYQGTVYLYVHNYTQHFFTIPLTVNPRTPRRVKVDLTALPKGVAELTLADSLGKPFVNRLFFAHFNQRDEMVINADKSDYRTREKVHLKLKLSDSNGQPLNAAVSVACVQANRLELKNANHIENYTYLNACLNDVPVKENYWSNMPENRGYLENVLLIKGWRRFKWLDVLNADAADTAVYHDARLFSGTIEQYGKPTKKPVNFVLHNKSLSHIITTKANGSFVLEHNQLVAEQDKLSRIVLNPNMSYNLKVRHHYDEQNSLLAQQVKPIFVINAEQPSESYDLKGMERAIQLREVVVKAKRDSGLYAVRGRNLCGDYVCMFNILNCPNHATDYNIRPPVIGQPYRAAGTESVILYQGCTGTQDKAAELLHGIYEAKQYYGSDYAVANPTEPEYFSTIFWKHLVLLNSQNETELSFYTSDVTGKFKIIVQGVTGNGVIYKEHSINVSKPL
jgi:hypothetical protein